MTGEAASVRTTGVGRVLRPMAKAHPTDSRTHNRSLILRTLFHDGSTSRAGMARVTGLTRVTVSDLVAELIEDGLVSDHGPRPDQKVGKPASIVELRRDARQIIAVDLSDALAIRGAVTDLTGTILSHETQALTTTGQEAFDQVDAMIARLLAQTDRPVLGIGIGSPGVVAPDGLILEAPNYGWCNLPMARLLAERHASPVYVANDANTAALAEFTFGDTSSNGLMVITVGKGLGAGIVLDGVLLRGHSYAAGEIGHVIAVEDGLMCACGRRGCLETVFSAPALRRILAEQDPKTADAAVASVGRAVGLILAPVVSAFDLGEIVMAGPAELLTVDLLEGLSKAITERVMPAIARDVTIRTAKLGENVTLIGAAALVLSGQLGVT